MKSPLLCERCGEQCGWFHEYVWGPNGCDPPDAEPWDEELVDDEGKCYCSEECMKPEEEPDEEHAAEWDRYYHERQVAKDDALEIQERADGVRR